MADAEKTKVVMAVKVACAVHKHTAPQLQTKNEKGEIVDITEATGEVVVMEVEAGDPRGVRGGMHLYLDPPMDLRKLTLGQVKHGKRYKLTFEEIQEEGDK